MKPELVKQLARAQRQGDVLRGKLLNLDRVVANGGKEIFRNRLNKVSNDVFLDEAIQVAQARERATNRLQTEVRPRIEALYERSDSDLGKVVTIAEAVERGNLTEEDLARAVGIFNGPLKKPQEEKARELQVTPEPVEQTTVSEEPQQASLFGRGVAAITGIFSRKPQEILPERPGKMAAATIALEIASEPLAIGAPPAPVEKPVALPVPLEEQEIPVTASTAVLSVPQKIFAIEDTADELITSLTEQINVSADETPVRTEEDITNKPLVDLSKLPIDRFVGREQKIVIELIKNSERGILRTAREVGEVVYSDDIENGRKTPLDAATTTSAAIGGALSRKLQDVGFLIVSEKQRTPEGRRLPSRFGIAPRESHEKVPTPQENGEVAAPRGLSASPGIEQRSQVEEEAELFTGEGPGSDADEADRFVASASEEESSTLLSDAIPTTIPTGVSVSRPVPRVEPKPELGTEREGLLDEAPEIEDVDVQRVFHGWDEFRLQRTLTQFGPGHSPVPDSVVPTKIKESVRFVASGIKDSFLSYDPSTLEALSCDEFRDDIRTVVRYMEIHPELRNLLDLTRSAKRQLAEISGKKISRPRS